MTMSRSSTLRIKVLLNFEMYDLNRLLFLELEILFPLLKSLVSLVVIFLFQSIFLLQTLIQLNHLIIFMIIYFYNICPT